MFGLFCFRSYCALFWGSDSFFTLLYLGFSVVVVVVVAVDRYYTALFSAHRADCLRARVILHERIGFCSSFLNIHPSGVLTALAWLVPHDTAAVSVRSVYTMQPCTMSLHAKPHT